MDHTNQIILIFNLGRGICVWTAALPLLQWYLVPSACAYVCFRVHHLPNIMQCNNCILRPGMKVSDSQRSAYQQQIDNYDYSALQDAEIKYFG